MADVRPFRGLTYSPDKVSVERVVTQPYDKISPEMRRRYLDLDPHNLVRVILGTPQHDDSPQNNVYTRAASTLREWKESGILERLSTPAFFASAQRFTIPGTGLQRLRTGFIGLGRLEDYANKVVYPHERTLAGPKEDRLNLLRHTRTHFEQIFMLYEDRERRIDQLLEEAATAAPDVEVTDEYGVIHTLWMLQDERVLGEIQDRMKGRKLIIADGHHRYETGLAYRNEQRALGNVKPDAPHEWLPMTFFNMESPALTVLPTHRVVRDIRGFDVGSFLERARAYFHIEELSSANDFGVALASARKGQVAIGVALQGGRCILLRLKAMDFADILADLSEKQRALDVVVLHRLIIDRCLGISEDAVRRESNITYVRELERAVDAVLTSQAQAAFLLNPVSLDQMRDVVFEGCVMPQKSTDFYPKVLSGLVLYSLDDA